MTTRDKAIVSAWTGLLMCDMAEMLKYMSEKLGWQLSEEELLSRHCDYKFNDELADKIKPDFLACNKNMLDCKSVKTFKKDVYIWTIKNKDELKIYKSDYYISENIF